MAIQQFPDGSLHDFPDEASPDDVAQAVGTWMSQHPAQPPPAAGAAAPQGSFLGSVMENVPGGKLPDIASAAVKASLTGVAPGTAGVAEALGETPESTWSERYQAELDRRTAAQPQWDVEHPTLSRYVAPVLGLAAGGPASGYAKAPVVLEPAARSLASQIARSAGVGGTYGAVTGATNAAEDPQVISGDAPWSRTARDVGTSAGWGSLFGGTLPVVGAVLSRPVSALARAIGGALPESWTGPGGFFGNAPAIQAARVGGRRIGEDVEAGGPGVQAIQERLEATPAGPLTADMRPVPGYQFTGGKPQTIADVGGSNVQALSGRIARTQEVASRFLNDRDAGAPDRLIDDVNKLIGTGADSATVEQGLINARQAAAQPAYQKALYDSSGAPRQVTDPAVADYVAGSAPLRNAMDAIKAANPEFTNTPYTDMRLLDQAYKAIGTKTFGVSDPVQQYNLDQIRRGFGNVLTKANPDYQTALDQYSGPSTSLQAIQDGRTALSNTPEANQQLINQYSPGDQRLFRLGAADALRTSVGNVGPGGNEALRIMGNRNLQERLRPLFSSDDEYQSFIDRAETENRMFQTRQGALGGSQTQPRQVEAARAGGGGEGGPAGQLVSGGAAMFSGDIPFGATQVGRGISGLARSAGADIDNPLVNAALARNLYSADPATQQRFLAQILALPPPAGQLMAPAVGSLAQQLVPSAAGVISRYGPLISAFRGAPERREER